MKKVLAMLLCLAMILGCLVGCAKTETKQEETEKEETKKEETKKEETKQEETKKEETKQEETRQEEKPLLNVDIYPLETSRKYTRAAADSIDNHEKNENWKHWSEVTGVEFDYIQWDTEQINTGIAGNSLPDCIINYSLVVPKNTLDEYGMGGKLVNFRDYLDIMPNFSKYLEEYPELYNFTAAPDGGFYTLPKISRTLTSSGNLVYLRTDMLKEMGWDHEPTTTEEFYQMILDAQEFFGKDDPDFCAYRLNNKVPLGWGYSNSQIAFFFPSFGDLLIRSYAPDKNGKMQFGAATEQFKHTLEYMHKIFESGAMNKSVYTDDGTAHNTLMTEGHVLATNTATMLTKDCFESGELDCTVLSPLTSEYSSVRHWQPGSLFTHTITIINAALPEEDIEILVKYIDALYSTRENPVAEGVWGLSAWLGTEGVDFELDDENECYVILPHEGYDNGTAWANVNNAGALGVGDFRYYENTGAGLMIKARGTAQKLLPYAEDVFDVALLSLTQDEQDVYNDVYNDLDLFIGEMTAKFISGELDIEAEWDGYIKELESIGYLDLLDIYQDAYDRYMAN